ncbi:MAG: M56 family metallopeptidase [Thermoanaerobaculia bacterium]|nr:M56 family metallopeptidase [Thermoanaerobaculia bacterium]
MLLYLLQVSLCWGLFALLYALLLRRETFFAANRVYLLTTAAAGLLLPVSGHWLPLPQTDAGQLFSTLPTAAAGFREMEESMAAWWWNDVVEWVYGIGATLALSRLLWGLGRLASLIARNRRELQADRTVMVYTDQARLPFSFFHWIFVSHNLEDQPDFREMLAHEKAHFQGWHSIDVMLLEILCVLFWFHPLAHWYRLSLRNVHEYQADAAATHASNRRQYSMILVRQIQERMPAALAHHFLQAPIRQRINMLTQKSSTPIQAWKYTLALPIVALFLVAFRQTPETGVYDNVYNKCERLPEFPGGMAALLQFMQTNLSYPEEDRKTGRSGMVGVTFVIGTSGKVEQIHTATLKGEPSAAMHLEAARIVKQMPRWLPAEHRGEKVKCQFVLPVRFALQ